MVQQRVYNFGDTLTQGRTKAVAGKLLSPGVYEGLEPAVLAPDILSLSPGSFLLPNGVLITETADITNIVYPPGWVGATGDFTLTADHDDIQAIGGSPVTYQIRPGLLDRSGDPNANSLALLWIRRQAAPLEPGFFSVPVKVKNGALLDYTTLTNGWKQAPFPEASDVTAGPNVTQANVSHKTGPQNTGVLISNSGVGAQLFQFTLAMPRLPWTRRVEVYADIPTGGSIGFNTSSMTLTAGATAGNAVIISVGSTAGFAAGDKVTIFDPVSLLKEVTNIIGITPTQFSANLSNSYTAGSIVQSLSVVTDEAGVIVPSTPSVISGAVTGLGAVPAGTLVLSSSSAKPATLGIRVVVPPGGTANGVFLKGFQFLGD